jgi:hypothetical protein
MRAINYPAIYASPFPQLPSIDTLRPRHRLFVLSRLDGDKEREELNFTERGPALNFHLVNALAVNRSRRLLPAKCTT